MTGVPRRTRDHPTKTTGIPRRTQESHEAAADLRVCPPGKMGVVYSLVARASVPGGYWINFSFLGEMRRYVTEPRNENTELLQRLKDTL